MRRSEAHLQFVVLGPLVVHRDGAALHIAARRQRALLLLLLLNVGRVVPAERLIDQLWDGSPPPAGRRDAALVRLEPAPGLGRP